MQGHIIKVISTLAVLGLLIGCAGTRSTASDPADAWMYPLTNEQAERVLTEAMAAEFSGSALSRVDIPNRGYKVTIRFALDSHDIVAVMVPAKGKTTDGEQVDGFVFEVNDSGTMAISGRRRANRLFEGIQNRASQVAPPVRLVGY